MKKISIKFFLNKNLKPLIINDIKTYPVYIRVTYNRKSTTFKFETSEYPDGLYLELKQEKNFEDAKIYPQFLAFEKVIETLVEKEVRRKKDRFDVKGIGDKIFTYYGEAISDILSDGVDKEMQDILKDKLTYNEYIELMKIEDFGERLILASEKLDNKNTSFDASFWGLVVMEFFISEFVNSLPNHTTTTPFDWFEGNLRPLFMKFYDKKIKKLKNSNSNYTVYGFLDVNKKIFKHFKPVCISIMDFVGEKMLDGEELPKYERITDFGKNISFGVR